MIDEHSLDATGHARFSDCRRFRYRLQRELTPGAFARPYEESRAVVFVMLNPSTADAFTVDPTVRRCIQFARRFGGDTFNELRLKIVELLPDVARAAVQHCEAEMRRARAERDAFRDACWALERDWPEGRRPAPKWDPYVTPMTKEQAAAYLRAVEVKLRVGKESP